MGSVLSDAQRVYSKLPHSNLEVHLSSTLNCHQGFELQLLQMAALSCPGVFREQLLSGLQDATEHQPVNVLWKHGPLLHSRSC